MRVCESPNSPHDENRAAQIHLFIKSLYVCVCVFYSSLLIIWFGFVPFRVDSFSTFRNVMCAHTSIASCRHTHEIYELLVSGNDRSRAHKHTQETRHFRISRHTNKHKYQPSHIAQPRFHEINMALPAKTMWKKTKSDRTKKKSNNFFFVEIANK